MAGLVVLRGGTLRTSFRSLASCLLIGILLPGANAVLFYAERNVPIGLASLIIASVPLWVVVLRLIGRERLPLPVLIGVGVGFSGVAVLARPVGGATGVGNRPLRPLGGNVGDRLGALAEAAAAAPIRSSRPPTRCSSGGLVMLPLGLATMGTFAPSTQSVLGWVYLVTIGSVVGYTAYVWLLANAPLSLVSTYAFMNPLVAISLGVLFQGEHLGTRLVVGAAIVVVAVAIVVTQEPPVATQREEGVR